jgi:hypothetical protein
MNDVRVIFTPDQTDGKTALPATTEDMQAIIEQFTERQVLAHLDDEPISHFWEVCRILEVNREDGWDIVVSDEDADGDIGPQPSLTDKVWMQRRKSVRKLLGSPRPDLRVRHVVMSRPQEEIACLAYLMLGRRGGCGPGWQLDMTRGQQKAMSAEAITDAQRLFADDRERALDLFAGVPEADGWPRMCSGIETAGTREERRRQLDCLLDERFEDLVFCRHFDCRRLIAPSDPFLLEDQETDDECTKRRAGGNPRRSIHSEHNAIDHDAVNQARATKTLDWD